MGMLADKDYRAVIDIISPFAAGFVCLTPDSPRALTAAELAAELRNRGFRAQPCQSAPEGIEAAFRMAEGTDGICKSPAVVAFGSLYMAGDVRSAFPDALHRYLVSCKKEQRKEALRRRRALTAEERAEKSAAICRKGCFFLRCFMGRGGSGGSQQSAGKRREDSLLPGYRQKRQYEGSHSRSEDQNARTRLRKCSVKYGNCGACHLENRTLRYP